jgi:hypothetical protein
MKNIFMILGLMLTALLVYSRADTKKDSQDRYQTATVVSVDKHVSESNYVGGSSSDAPLQAEGYSYDIGIRLNCNVYVGLYQSATNYLPSDFAPNKTVDVRFRKHVMYISRPYSDWDMKMGILSHRRIRDEACPARG